MLKPPLPFPFSKACKRLPRKSQSFGAELLQFEFALGISINRALQTGGGSTMHQTVDFVAKMFGSIADKTPASTKWPERFLHQLHDEAALGLLEFTPIMDGWNIFFIRKRYRDVRQRETVFQQLAGQALITLFQLLDGKKPEKEIKSQLFTFAQGYCNAQVVRRFWYNVHEGRILISDAELEQHEIDPQTFLDRTVSPALENLLISLSLQAQTQMQTALAQLKSTDKPGISPFLQTVLNHEEACLRRCAKINFSPTEPIVQLPFLQRFFLP